MKEKDFSSGLLMLSYTLFFIGLLFSFRAVSSISVFLLVITAAYRRWRHTEKQDLPKEAFFFFLFLLAYFFWQFYSFILAIEHTKEWEYIRLKSGLVFTSLAVLLYTPTDYEKKKLYRTFIALLVMACVYMLAAACYQFFKNHQTDAFFYHQLSSSLHQHAVYFSLIILFATLILLEFRQTKKIVFTKSADIVVFTLFSVFIFLLSSKLIIAAFLLILLYFSFRGKNYALSGRKSFLLVGIVLFFSTLLFITPNPISNRFREVVKTDWSVIKKRDYNPAQYFNGLQFRLLQWRLVPDILHKENKWLTGTGNTNAQPLLSQEYKKRNMYAGITGTADKGYMLYNTHNQFLETLLRNGVIGLLILLLAYISLLWMSIRQNNILLLITTLVLLAYSFTESVLETQYGIIIFIFFPLFFMKKQEPTHETFSSI